MAETNDVRIAIVGCGYIGARHAASLARLPDVTIAALVDRDQSRAAMLRDQFELSTAIVTTDFAKVLRDPTLHAVIIATHHDSHASLAI
ncbi:MAG: Gfo/Idh/MocA family protein, partial [Thermomicrobiales bacterium]